MAIKNLNTGGASGVLFTDRRDFYIDPNVTKELWTDVTPFTTLVSNKETRQTNDPVFKMFEHRNPWVKQYWKSNGDTDELKVDNTTETEVTVNDASNLVIDSSLVGIQAEVWSDGYASKKGVVVVTAVNSSTVLKVKTIMTTSGSDTALQDDDIFLVIGNAQGEGTTSPEAWSDELKVVYNSTQIFKTPLEITGSLLQASLRGESSELARLRVMKGQEHKMQKEKAFLFGARVGGTNLGGGDGAMADGGITDADSKKIRTTYGIISAIEKYGYASGDDQNKFTIGDSYTYSNFVDHMEKVFQYVPEAGVKQAFCGAGALGYFSKMDGTNGIAGKSGWTDNLSDMKRDALGFNYKALETPHGILQLIPTPALRGPYSKTMLVIDDSNMFHAQYRNQMYQTNIKTENAYDGVKDQYMSDEGIGITLIESHNLFTITA